MLRCLVVFALLLAGSIEAAAARRLALVFGNAAYRSVPALANPVRDAAAVAEALEAARFEVTLSLDDDLPGMRRAVADFAAKLRAAGPEAIATVFYAGHAVQLDGSNFLLPVDARLTEMAEARSKALPLSDILKQLDASPARAKIVILDACRDNPFLSPGTEGPRGLSVVDSGAESRGAGNESGLARIDSKGGTLVAFSTSPGATALDGTGRNSPYAAALVATMREPGLPVEQVFKRVRVAVHDATQGAQIPWETSSLTANVSFIEPEGTAPAPRVALQPAGPRPTRETFAGLSADAAYRAAIEWDDMLVYKAFLDAHPEDQRALQVYRILDLRQDVTAWASAVRDGSREAFEAYLSVFPASRHASAARRLLERAPRRVAALGAGAGALACAPGETPRLNVPLGNQRRAAAPEPRRAVRQPARESQRRSARRPVREIEVDAEEIEIEAPVRRPAAGVVVGVEPAARPNNRWSLPPAYWDRVRSGGNSGGSGGSSR